MDRPSDSQKPTPASQRKSPPAREVPPSYRSLYLIQYNFVSAVLWAAVLGRVVLILSLHGSQNVYIGVGELVKWTQTLAGMEVLHSLSGTFETRYWEVPSQANESTGFVRASLPTTILQVASRLLLIWAIVHPFPALAHRSLAYSTMLLAWSTSEVIRYSYFAVNLAWGRVPYLLTWLRYNSFFVLYPLGIASECWLVWLAMGPARQMWGEVGVWALRAILAVYVPGSYVLFTHMMAQRRKVMRGLEGGKKVR